METMESVEWPPISLSWSQKLAAFWSIWWPAWLSLAVVILIGAVIVSPGESGGLVPNVGLVGALAYLVGQVVFVSRLVKKKYRSFRIVVERVDGSAGGRLSLGERLRVAVRIVGTQALFMIVAILVLGWGSQHFDEQTMRGANGFLSLGWFMVVGPYSLSFAVPASYRGFRLQAYGQRYV